MANNLLNISVVLIKTNKSGAAHVQGDVCVEDSSNANAVVNNTGGAYVNSVIWVCVEPDGVSSNAKGKYASGGYVSKINLDTSAALNDFVRTSTTAKKGTPHAVPATTGDFAMVLGTGTTPAAVLLGVPRGSAGGNVATDVIWNAKGDLAGGTGSDTAARLAVGSNGQVLTADSVEATGMKWAAGGGGGGTTFYDRRWVRGSTANSLDDEFNDASLAVAWGRVDASGGSGRVTWTEEGDSLSALCIGGDGQYELHARMKSYAMAVGESIQCHLTVFGQGVNYPHAGLLIHDGNTYGSGVGAFLSYQAFYSSPNTVIEWTKNAYGGVYSSSSQTGVGFGTSLHMRIKYTAVNTFDFYVSPDGISWTSIGQRSMTMTPSHIGIAVNGSTSSYDTIFSFDYFRVNP